MKKLQKRIIIANRKALIMAILLYVGGTLTSCSAKESELVLALETSQSRSSETESTQTSEESMENDSFVYVYVCGAVNTPSVVKLLLGSRAQAAVEAAGGFREDADIDAVNLAAFVEDAQCLDIPTIEESILKEKEFQNTKDGIVNLNTADSSQLTTLPGIGESRAQDIIAYREEYGEFVVIEDIMKVPGIKESAFAKIKSKITVG